jgi:hypothetical protein
MVASREGDGHKAQIPRIVKHVSMALTARNRMKWNWRLEFDNRPGGVYCSASNSGIAGACGLSPGGESSDALVEDSCGALQP